MFDEPKTEQEKAFEDTIGKLMQREFDAGYAEGFTKGSAAACTIVSDYLKEELSASDFARVRGIFRDIKVAVRQNIKDVKAGEKRKLVKASGVI